VQNYLGTRAETDFVRAIVAEEFETVALEEGDYERALDIMREYEDTRLGFVDSAIVAIAERLDCRHILTLDRRHFSAVRPSHARSFRLLPQDL
jgi:predicted nucleic acid-binding protein